ncbi:MAG: methyltransferase domain-containing protein [Patescibacteria group bacterium]
MNFSDPETNVKELSLKEGARVADFGAGSGAYVFALASAVGQSGRVFAIDVQQELLARISKDAERERIRNIEFVWADLETDGGSRLEAGSMDAVIISNILFQAEKKEVLIGEAGRVLRSGGELLVIDWSESFGNLGPRAGDVITLARAREILSSSGLSESRTIDAGSHHWGVIFKKQ